MTVDIYQSLVNQEEGGGTAVVVLRFSEKTDGMILSEEMLDRVMELGARVKDRNRRVQESANLPTREEA